MKTCRDIFESINMGEKRGSVKYDHFLELYDLYLNKYRSRKMNVLEIGVQAGGSMRLWEEYFPNAIIYGIDCSKLCKEYKTERVKIFVGDQSDDKFLIFVGETAICFDIIIDDGSHVCSHQRISFETLFNYLSNDGIYIIEDIHTSYWRSLGGSAENNNPENFIEYSKELVECVNAGALNRGKIINKLNRFNNNIEYIHFHNNIIIIQKGKTKELKMITTKEFKVL